MLPRSGPVVTASGLIFMATKDEGKLRAYDENTGEVLWEVDLPAASEGVPAVYEVDGREYLVLGALAVAVLLIGLWPAPLLDATRVSMQHLAQQLLVSKIAP